MNNPNTPRLPDDRKARPLHLTRVIEVDIIEGGPNRITLDGERADSSRMNYQSILDFPFDLIYVDGQLSFDTQVWINGNLRFLMPPESLWSTSVADSMVSGMNEDSILLLPTDGNDWRGKLQDLRTELGNHQGSINHIEWDRLFRMSEVHGLNFQDLKTYLSNVLTEEVFLSEIISQSADPSKREQHLARIDQHLHNYVASGDALSEQVNKLMKPYLTTEFGRRFTSKLKDFETEGVISFFRDLRNFLAHQNLPFTEQSFSFTTEPQLHHFSIGISVSELLRNKRWAKESRAYISSAKDKIDILSAVIDAYSLETKLWDWTMKQAYQLNKIHRAIANEIVSEANWVQSSGSQGRPRKTWASPTPAL